MDIRDKVIGSWFGMAVGDAIPNELHLHTHRHRVERLCLVLSVVLDSVPGSASDLYVPAGCFSKSE